MPLTLLTIQLWCRFALPFPETRYATAQNATLQLFGFFFFSTDESLCREPRHSAIGKEQNIDSGFFAVFCKAIEKELSTLAPRASGCKCCLVPCCSLPGSALQVLLRIWYNTFINTTRKSTATEGLTQNTRSQWKDPQQLQQILYRAPKELSIPGNAFI